MTLTPVYPNLLTDGGLELWDDSNTPTHWFPAAVSTSTVNKDTRSIEGESFWARMAVNGANSSCGIYQPEVDGTYIAIEAGEKYRFWFTWKVSASGFAFKVDFAISDSNEANPKFLKDDGVFSDSILDGIAINSTDSLTYTVDPPIDMTIPAGYVNFDLFFHNISMANQMFYIDRVFLFKLVDIEDGPGGTTPVYYNSDTVTVAIAERRHVTSLPTAPTYYKTDLMELEIAEKTYVFADSHKERNFLNAFIIGEYNNDNGKAINAHWKSKRLDFTDQYPQYLNTYKTIDTIQLEYVDEVANTPVTMYISIDGGVTWDFQTISLGNGDGKQRIQEFFWLRSLRSTGKYFTFKVESVSSSTKFTWTGLFVLFEPKGEYFNV